MYTTKHRPGVFEDVMGQDENVEVFKAVIKRPEESPRSLIVYGDWGTGKTTCVRIFAKALNCLSNLHIKPCGQCDVCKSDLSFTPYYQEFDSSQVGNVEAIRDMKNDFFLSSSSCKWRVIVFDEAHLIGRQAQGALLKVLEEMPGNLFVCFATTDVQNVLNTIQSRSLLLSFRRLSLEEIKANLRRIITIEQIIIPEEILNSIAMSSQGHVRDSVMMLDLYSMMEDKSKFMGGMRSAEFPIIEFLIAIKKDKPIQEYVTEICKKPLDRVRLDFYLVMRNMIYSFGGGKVDSFYTDQYEELKNLYGADALKLFAYTLSDWACNCFKMDLTVQAFLWSLKAKFKQTEQKLAGSSLLDRATKR